MKSLFYQERRASLAGLTLPHFYACPKLGPGFRTSYIMIFFVLKEIDFFFVVDIGRIDDYRCLNFPFLNYLILRYKNLSFFFGHICISHFY
jgi:hypothetical protein